MNNQQSAALTYATTATVRQLVPEFEAEFREQFVRFVSEVNQVVIWPTVRVSHNEQGDGILETRIDYQVFKDDWNLP